MQATVRVFALMLVLTILFGLAYPLAVTGLAQILFPYQAGGSLVEANGKVVGSALIARNFSGEGYFRPRPSAAGKGYDAGNSSGSNLAVTNKDLVKTFSDRIAAEKKLDDKAGKIPADLVTASASGLDPHITPEAAVFQAARVARARGMKPEDVQTLIDRLTEGRTWGVLGMPRVNVLALNMELDKIGRK